MRNTLKPLLLATFFGLSLSTSAQFEVINNFEYRASLNLTPHDSIVYAYSDGTLLKDSILVDMFNTNQVMDSAWTYDRSYAIRQKHYTRSVGNQLIVYQRTSKDNFKDTTMIYRISKDVNGRDSAFLLERNYNNDPNYDTINTLNLYYYGSSGELDSVQSLTETPFGSFSRDFTQVYYHNNGQLDSAKIWAQNIVWGRSIYTYQSNEIHREHYAITLSSNGQLVLINKQIYFLNSQNLIYRDMYLSWTGSTFEMGSSISYYLKTSPNVSLDEKESKPEVSLYPNPADGFIQVEPTRPYESFEVLSLDGQKLLSGSQPDRIDIGSLPQGMYVLNLVSGNSPQTQKFVKR